MRKKTSPVDVHVGLRVRGRRILLGMTQTATAKALGVSFQQLQKYEKGVDRLTPSRLAMLASVLKVSITFFFEGTADPQDVATMTDLGTQLSSSGTGVRLVQAFGAITDVRKRAAIVALVQALADREEEGAT